jgi:hypothetical protein
MANETIELTTEPVVELSRLDKRRPRIYLTLLLFQILSLLMNMILLPASKDANTLISFHTANLVNVFFALLLTGATINFLYYFVRKKIFFWIGASLFFVSIGLNAISSALKLNESDFELYCILFGTACFISVVMLCFTFYIAIRDIFGKNLTIGSALLGAANVYLLIGSGFAFLYAFMSILMPGAMIPVSEMEELFNHCVINSTFILSGMDLPGAVQEPAFKNAMMFESIFAHLFAVFIVGRLLAK